MVVRDYSTISSTMEVYLIDSVDQFIWWAMVTAIRFTIINFAIIIASIIIPITIVIVIIIMALKIISAVIELSIDFVMVAFIKLECCFYFIFMVLISFVVENLSLFFVNYWLKENFV